MMMMMTMKVSIWWNIETLDNYLKKTKKSQLGILYYDLIINQEVHKKWASLII